MITVTVHCSRCPTQTVIHAEDFKVFQIRLLVAEHWTVVQNTLEGDFLLCPKCRPTVEPTP
jgi:hypothetical protein